MKKIIFLFSFLIIFSAFTEAQYHIYGITYYGGANNYGSIFSYSPFTNKDSVLFNFNETNGSYAESDFLLASDGLLYSLTEFGGINNMGTIFSFNPRTFSENVLVSLDSLNGEIVHGCNDLIQAKDGTLYGTIFEGGLYNLGVLFSYGISTQKDSVLFNFAIDTIAYPCRSLYQDTATGFLYGITESGGKYNGGVLFKFDTYSNTDSVLVNFTMTNHQPYSSLSGLMRASNGLLYSMALAGGDSNFGAIFSYDIKNRVLKTEFSFNGINGEYPRANTLIQLSNGEMFGMTTNGGTDNDGVLFEFNPANDSEKVLMNFNGTNGSTPYGGLLWDPYNALIYGMTYAGGSNNQGVLFSFDTLSSTYTKIFDFTGTNGAFPCSSLIIVQDSEKITTGINEIKGESEKVKVYPNPNSGIFNIELIGAQNPDGYRDVPTIEIYNVLGEKILTGNLAPQTPKGALNEIDISAQPSGIYFYRVLQPSGECIGEGKVIVQR